GTTPPGPPARAWPGETTPPGPPGRPAVGILVISSALPVAPSAASAAIRSISSVLSPRTGPSGPWNTPTTRASASVAVGADWLVSSVTVILLMVGHRPSSSPAATPVTSPPANTRPAPFLIHPESAKAAHSGQVLQGNCGPGNGT